MRLKYLILIGLIVLGLAMPLQAKTIYVRGVTKITMRTGPGTSNKIVAMLLSGTKLEIIEYQKDWSQVVTDDGKTGWVLTRFLTEEVPRALVVKQLKAENQRLETALEEARETGRDLETKNQTLTGIEKKYRALQKASADYLKLDAEHKELLKTSEAQKTQIQDLQQSLNDEEKLWFLSGAGVFIVGLILGLSTRKKKNSSLLS
ncbi:MAG: TIGR04211 family SH3 domain-containing protein [Desulfobacter sp.]|nr:MAG: TIGR04211 family SH3 domain-containing protein [Desulfobacter sp.]